MVCGYEYQRPDGDPRRCPRPTAEGAQRCVFHLPPDGRRAGDVSSADLREAVCADLHSDDSRRYEYVDVTVPSLDLSALTIETDGVEPLTFRSVVVEGTVDLSGSTVRAPIAFEDCRIGRLDAMDCHFERDVVLSGCRLGSDDPGSCFSVRRATIEERLDVTDSEFHGSIEFAGSQVGEWLEFDGVMVTGGAHFPNATVDRAQFVDSTFHRSVRWTGLEADQFTVEGVEFGPAPRLDEASLGLFRCHPRGDVELRLVDARIDAGRLAAAENGRALYDLTDATVGDVEIDCEQGGLDRYRFYRTEYDGFSFSSYRRFLREERWQLHQYAGTPETPAENTGLERTYLEAKQGASTIGDHESAAAFFVREMRYRRRRYASHALDETHSPPHRFDAVLRWVTNAFLDAVSGFGERPQRTVGSALAVILSSGLVYPAVGGLETGGHILTYGKEGLGALATSLYFSVTTFTTLGLGDVHPASSLGRTVAAGEALAGAFLTALFVFALGRRVTR